MVRAGYPVVNRFVTLVHVPGDLLENPDSEQLYPALGCGNEPVVTQFTRRRMAAPAARVPAADPATPALKSPSRAALRPVR
jgi:hypothetical protein